MKRLINAIKDLFYEVTDHTLILIVILIIGVILVWRFNILFDFSVNKPELSGDKRPTIEKNHEKSPIKEDLPDSEKTPAEEQIIAKKEKITVPAGSTGSDIAKILFSKGLINDISVFLNRAVELKLDTKLKSGTFELSRENSIDEILKIISMTN